MNQVAEQLGGSNQGASGRKERRQRRDEQQPLAAQLFGRCPERRRATGRGSYRLSRHEGAGVGWARTLDTHSTQMQQQCYYVPLLVTSLRSFLRPSSLLGRLGPARLLGSGLCILSSVLLARPVFLPQESADDQSAAKLPSCDGL